MEGNRAPSYILPLDNGGHVEMEQWSITDNTGRVSVRHRGDGDPREVIRAVERIIGENFPLDDSGRRPILESCDVTYESGGMEVVVHLGFVIPLPVSHIDMSFTSDALPNSTATSRPDPRKEEDKGNVFAEWWSVEREMSV